VRSRVLIGVGAWLLGAVAATGGSMFAVNRLDQDLLAQQDRQISVSAVNAELALEKAELPSASPSPSASKRPTATRHRHARHHARPAPARTLHGVLLASPDGTVVAACERGGAYLMYWSPQQGFEADDVVRGPAPIASVSFRSWSDGIAMHVSCRDGAPVARQVTVGGIRHDE
jgi:hypothetical protein